jgi:hypothetical protein
MKRIAALHPSMMLQFVANCLKAHAKRDWLKHPVNCGTLERELNGLAVTIDNYVEDLKNGDTTKWGVPNNFTEKEAKQFSKLHPNVLLWKSRKDA